MSAQRISIRRVAAIPSLAMFGAALLFLAGLAAALFEEQLYRTQKSDELAVQAQILAANITAALAFRDEQAARENVTALSVNPELQAAGVYDEQGQLFAGFVRPGVEALPQSAQLSGARINGNAVIAGLPVAQNGTPLGSVYLRATLQPLGLRIIRYGGIILLLTMASLVLAVSFAGQRALKRANEQLETQARDLAASNIKLQREMIERAKAEEALRQSQKMEAIGQLSGGIAHDFNNLIAIVQGNLRLLKRRIAQGRTDVQPHLDAIADTMDRAATLTQRILAFSRRQPLSPRAVDLNQLLADMRDLLRHSVGERVRIDWRLAADWRIFCDDQQLQTVILNLAINARDAMPDGGMLMIETANVHIAPSDETPPADHVRLTIRDTGTGMSEEVRRKAIDPFFTTKAPGRGTGLGLSMTFGFVQQSGGHLQIHSELGKGTTVTILMPKHTVASMEVVS